MNLRQQRLQPALSDSLGEEKWNEMSKMHGLRRGSSARVEVERLLLLKCIQNATKISASCNRHISSHDTRQFSAVYLTSGSGQPLHTSYSHMSYSHMSYSHRQFSAVYLTSGSGPPLHTSYSHMSYSHMSYSHRQFSAVY